MCRCSVALYACLLISAASVLVAALPAVSSAQEDLRPIVVLREDDLRATWRTPHPEFGGVSALEYGKLKRIPVTWGVITSLTDAGGCLTWSELKSYLDAAGGEAASHSVIHSAMPSAEAYAAELVNSKAIIEQRLGAPYTCNTFLQPGSWTEDANLDSFAKYDNAVSQAIRANYSQSMAYLSDGWQVGRPHYRYGTNATFSLDYAPDMPESEMRALLEAIAQTPGLVFSFVCHGVQPTGGTNIREVPANLMKALMDGLATLRDQGRIRLMGLHQAFATEFPSGLNCMPNARFEAYSVECSQKPLLPWQLFSGAVPVEQGGIDNSRCVRIAGSGSKVQSAPMLLGPGSYELTWYQRVEDAYPVAAAVQLEAMGHALPYASTARPIAAWPSYTCSQPSAWEQKRALFVTRCGVPKAYVAFIAGNANGSPGGFRIDNVEVKLRQADPLAPPELAIAPSLAGFTVSWTTPDITDITRLVCRYGTRTHPVTPSDGYAGGSAEAIRGQVQSVFVPLSWNQVPHGVYVSVFSQTAEGYSQPAVEYLIPDKTAPIATCNTPEISGDQVTVSWNATDAESPVVEHEYSLGTSPGAADIIPPTTTVTPAQQLNGLPLGRPLYLSIRARNAFGLWSGIQTVSFFCPPLMTKVSSISAALALADESGIEIAGQVSAVFGTCFYLQQRNGARGIRVDCTEPVEEDQIVTVQGMLRTVDGERRIDEAVLVSAP